MATAKKNWIIQKSIFIACDNCKKEYKIYKKDYNRCLTHCCSRKCSGELSTKKSGNKRKGQKNRKKNATDNCLKCGKEFHHYKWDTQLYCSIKCSRIRNKVKVSCINCGEETYKANYTIKRNDFNYCGRECYNSRKTEGLRKIKRHTSFFMNLVENGCECGIKEYYLLQVHHKDGDNSNNQLNNFEVVCANCHIKRHLKLNKKGKLVYHPNTLTSTEILKLIK